MRNLKKYWQEVRALERELPEFVWLTSAGSIGDLVEVKAEQAAKLLHTGSHRRATDEEIAVYRGKIDAQRRQMFMDELRRKGVEVVPVYGPRP
jgi:hypothetical protein